MLDINSVVTREKADTIVKCLGIFKAYIIEILVTYVQEPYDNTFANR